MAFFYLSKIGKKVKKYATLTVKINSDDDNNDINGKQLDSKENNFWVKCPQCQEILYKTDIFENLNKCNKCDHYFSLSARERISLLIDEGTFKEENAEYRSKNPIDFPDYLEKYRNAQHNEDLYEAVIEGTGLINGIKVSIAAMDFAFMGGSMGSVVGEKITETMERGIKEKIPVIVVSTSGGARMQEGMYSLMQMAKTSAAAEKLKQAKIPFISIPVNPTTGGVSASFAMLGDIIITEPKSRIGFAGPRVIEQTIKQKLPSNFQKAEFLKEHGMVDIIVKREEMKEVLFKILSNLI